MDAQEGQGLVEGCLQLLDQVGVDGEGQDQDDKNLEPVPQLTTNEAPSLTGGEEEDPLGPERREENVKTDDHWRKKQKQAQPGDLVFALITKKLTSLLSLTWDPPSVKPLKQSLAILVVIFAIFHIVRMFF